MTEKKHPSDMTPEERKNIKVEFAPGAFDSFDGTQEELDQFMAEIMAMIEDGSLFDNSTAIDLGQLIESDEPEDQELAAKLIRSLSGGTDPRNLQ